MISLGIGLGVTLGTGGGSAPEVIPFTSDADTFWWDYTKADTVIDTSLGLETVSYAYERIRRANNRIQSNKARQPLLVTGSGINYNTSTDRRMQFDVVPSLTNGKNGWYWAGVIRVDTSGVTSTIFEIARNGATAASRGQLQVTGSRIVTLRGNNTDSSTVNIVATGPTLTLNQTYALEVEWNFDTDAVSIWLDGVSQTVTPGAAPGPWTTFPASEPSQIIFGNGNSDNVSFTGLIRTEVFQNGVPSAGIRSSVSDYMQTRKAA